jgi:hypothetical protein
MRLGESELENFSRSWKNYFIMVGKESNLG